MGTTCGGFWSDSMVRRGLVGGITGADPAGLISAGDRSGSTGQKDNVVWFMDG